MFELKYRIKATSPSLFYSFVTLLCLRIFAAISARLLPNKNISIGSTILIPFSVLLLPLSIK